MISILVPVFWQPVFWQMVFGVGLLSVVVTLDLFCRSLDAVARKRT